MAAHAWIVGVSRGAFPQAEHHHPRGDRAAGDDEALVPARHERGDLGRQPAELPRRRACRRARW